ncbi:MAG: AI-2E family transporter [Nanoarchaeota archaeon]
MAGNNTFSKNFFLIALITLTALSFFIIKPLFVSMASGAILAYLFYPIYKFIVSKTKSRRIAAGIVILLILLVTIIPIYFIADSVTKEGFNLFITTKQKLTSGNLETVDCAQNPKPFCEITNRAINGLKDPQVKFYIEDTTSKISTYVISKASDFAVNLPVLIINLFVMFFVIYYFLLDGTVIVEKARRSVPLKKHHVDHIMSEFANFTHATLYGQLVTSLIQGVLGGTIFYLLGVPTPILAGLAMAFFAFIPFLGTPIVWLPATISLFFAGETNKAIILLLLGVFVISTIDNIIKPKIIGNRVRLHPVLILVGIIGGLYLFGAVGLLIGPLVFSLLISFIEVYYKEGLGFEH